MKILIPLLLLAVILAGCVRSVPTANPGSINGTVQSNQIDQTTPLITEEEAKNIALQHAGFTADQVTQLRVGFDYDDGIPEYDVHFREGYLEYEYEIHAKTGQILSFEKDD